MSVFSEHLNKLIHKSRFTLPSLEKESGFTVSMISKIKNGTRLPDSEEKMLGLIRALHCSIEEERFLMQEYRIEKMGRNTWLCMEECRRTLEMLSTRPSPVLTGKLTDYRISSGQLVEGEPNINTLLQYVIDLEAKKPGGSIRMIIQPDYRFLIDYLLTAFPDGLAGSFKMEHIIALHGRADTASDSENMRLTGSCLQLSCMYGESYQSFYHYKTEFAADLYPYCFLTAQYGLLIGADCQTALLFSEEAVLAFLHHTFCSLRQKCSPLLAVCSSPVGFLQSHAQLIFASDAAKKPVLEISRVPCILTCIPPHTAKAHIHPALAQNAYVTKFLNAYWSKANFSCIKTIFMLDGLALFMQTGICYELPRNSHSPFSLQERIQILRIFLEKCSRGQIVPILLKEYRINISPELCITAYNDRDVSFIWNPQHASFTSCFLKETGITASIADFLHYIQASPGDAYSPQDSMTMLMEYTEQYDL